MELSLAIHHTLELIQARVGANKALPRLQQLDVNEINARQRVPFQIVSTFQQVDKEIGCDMEMLKER